LVITFAPGAGPRRRQLAISCADALELMTDQLEGALSEADAVRMRAHLEGCEACKVYLDQLRATIEIVRKVNAPEEFPVDPTRVNSLVDLFRCERPD
jgi:predicted anti-sigma-YlaC factor YlaD